MAINFLNNPKVGDNVKIEVGDSSDLQIYHDTTDSYITNTTGDLTISNTGDDLSVSVETYADGETGSWTNIACQTDPVYAFSASLTCCPPPTVLSSDENCLGSSDGFITVTGQGVAPFDYQWIDPLGNTFSNNNII